MPLSREDLIQELNSIDQVNDLTNWKYKDIHLWPILRNLSFSIWHKEYKESINNVKKPKTNSRFNQVYVAWINLLLGLMGFFEYLSIMIRLRKVNAPTIFCASWSHRIHFNGHFMNRYFDSIVSEYKIDDYIFIEYDRPVADVTYFGREKITFSYRISLFLNLISRFLHNYSNVAKQVHDQSMILDNLSRLLKVTRPQLISKLVKTVIAIDTQANFWSEVIRKARTARVFVLCYYNLEPYGLTVACKRVGIPSIDLQHGGITSLHQAYSGFSKIPIGGYQTVPSIFWCWDLPTAKIIESWAKPPWYKVVVGGNPWYIEGKNRRLSSDYELPISKRKRVLYTLQYTYLDEFVIETIQQTVNQLDWYLRLHPRELHNRHVLEKQLANYGLLDKVDVSLATSYPLQSLLQQVSIHVSKFSGSILEAMELGVPTIIIDQLGFELAKMHDGSGLLFMLSIQSGEEFKKLLSWVSEEFSDQDFQKETARNQIKNALVQLGVIN